MHTSICQRILALALALVMVFGLCPAPAHAATAGDDGSAVMNEGYEARETLVPIGPSFSVPTILEWTPESDPDAIYSRATVKLAERHGGFVVNPLANPEAKLQLCAMPNSSHDEASAQGNENFFSYCFNYWQYADSFIYWTGSEEGIIACPTGEFVDAAHTNGVPVVATLGFPWGGGYGYVEQVRNFCQKAADGTFPVADKLIEVMDYYGFDGYFFNQESYGCSAEIATRLNEMIHYMHKLRPDMLISWYDSMTAGGGVSYQDAVNDSNKLWMEFDDEGTMGVNEFMMNYNWTDSKIRTTISTMRSIGRSEFDAFAGFNVQANVYGDNLRDYLLVDEDGLARISLSLYYNNQTITLAKDGEDFHKTEQSYYVNKVGDPRQNPVDLDSSEWAGMSRFFADKTVILDAPFVTDFNTGHGHGWFVNGEKLRDTDWSYQSVQDVLPTWTWIIDSEGSKLSAGYDFTTAYNGGSSLKFSGTLDATNTVMLYSTKVAVQNGMTLGVVSMGSNAKLVAYYGDDTTGSYEACEQVAYGLNAGTDWTETVVDISSQAGKTLYAIGLVFASEETVADYQFRLGRLAILDKERNALRGPASVTLDDILYEDAFHAEARIYWDKVTGAGSYQVYKRNPDGSRTMLLETPNTALYIPTLVRYAAETDVTLEVVPVNRNGVAGTGTELTIDWLYGNDDSEVVAVEPSVNVNLGATVTDFSEQGDGAECDKALDGIAGNASKWWASGSGDWFSIDLGQPRAIKRIRVVHAEGGGESKDLNTDTFTVYYKDETGSWVQAYKVSGNTDAITDDVLDEAVTAREWKLEVNRIGPSPWSAVNIYEWEMYETGFPKSESVPMHFASAHNGVGADDTFTLSHVTVGDTVKAYLGQTLLGEAAATSDTVTLTGLDFGTAEAGRVHYTVTRPGYQESARQSTPFDAEAAEISEPARDVVLEEFSRDGSVSSSRFEGIYVSLTVNGLGEGDVVYLADGRRSLPVAAGDSSATIRGIWVPRAGGALDLQVKRLGKTISEVYSVETPTFDEPTATIHLYAYNADGESLTGAQFELLNASGDQVAQLGTTSDSGGKALVPLGTYTIRCTGVPEGYEICDDLMKIVAIEGWTYEMKASIASESTVEPTDPTDPTDPEPTDPEPTDPEPTDPVVPDSDNVALGAEVIAYNGDNLGGEAGPEKLFDGDKENLETGKWGVDGVNMWVAFDIGENRDFGSVDIYHAEYAGEWTPGKGQLNTTAYEFYTLDTSKVNVDELLAMSFTERTALLQDNDNWILLADVDGNQEDVTSHELSIRDARIFKLNVSDTDDTNWGDYVRVYEVEMKALPKVVEPELVSSNAKIWGTNSNAAEDEGAPYLFDGDLSTKWCSEKTPNWLVFDVGAKYDPTRVVITHAGASVPAEDERFNTNNFSLQILNFDMVDDDIFLSMSDSERATIMSMDTYWVDLVNHPTNELSITDDALEAPNAAQIYRLKVIDGDDNWWNGPDTIRIYELELYGVPAGSAPAPETYTITIGDLVGGTVTADCDTAEPGQTVTLTVVPERGFHYVEGSLTVNGEAIEGFTFEMPAEDVVIYAEFEVSDDVLEIIQAAKAEAARAQAAAEEAARQAEEARAAAEAAAASAAEDREAADKAQQKAEEAQAAAEEAQRQAEAAAAAAEEANLEAATAAANAAESANAAASSAAAAAEAQRLAQEAQYAAEVAQAAAEAAAASTAEDREAAEAAAAAAEEAKAAAEEAKAAADESRLDAARAASEAANSAALAARSAEVAQAAQQNAEEAAALAAEAQAGAEEAQRKAEEAAETAGAESEAAEDARRQAEAAAEAAENARKAAEEAAAAAETAAAAAKESELAAAQAAATAAEYARLAAEAYAEIVEMKNQMIDYVNEAILAAEAAKKAELALAKTYALVRLADVETDGVCIYHKADVDAIIAAATEAINAAETPAQVEELVNAALAEIEAVLARICAAEKFTDVPAASWYHEGVDFVLEKGYMVGMSDSLFGAADSLNRAHIVTLLYRIAGSPDVSGLTHPFVDVPANTFYADAVAWGYNQGIVTGMTDQLYGPNESVNRAQLATFLYRFCGSEKVEEDHLSAFVDADQVFKFARDAMNWAVANGIITGTPTSEGLALACGQNANRAQVAVLLERWLNK